MSALRCRMGAGTWGAIAAGRRPPAGIISRGTTTRGRAQRGTIPSEWSAERRVGAGSGEDPRRGNTYFPQRVVSTPWGTRHCDQKPSRLPWKTKSEIEVLLGPSLETPYFASTGRDMIYVLGPERSSYFRIDSEWLLIWLDENGRFHRYTIAND